jgi:hypothetical protein
MIDWSAPVVVGGVGGSGTRVVAPTCLTSLSGISHVRLFKALELFEELMFRRFTVPAGNPDLWIKVIWFAAFFWNDLKVSGRVKILRTGFSYWFCFFNGSSILEWFFPST